MKSDFVGMGEADLISSEAVGEDFIVRSTISLTILKFYDIIIERGDCYGVQLSKTNRLSP